jgi:hypothetical protein
VVCGADADRDRQHERANPVEHEQHTEHAADSVENEVEVDPAHHEQRDRAECAPGHERAAAHAGETR